LLKVSSISDLTREVFGPVLHVCTFKSQDLPQVISDINATGYGLTFGLHTRIDERVQEISDQVVAGNIYVNRNQIGAIVGSQPFGGAGLSGTGPKAGGPLYVSRFRAASQASTSPANWDQPMTRDALEAAIANAAPGMDELRETLPGPTGELNRLTTAARAPFLCMGPGLDASTAQAEAVRALGGRAIQTSGSIPTEWLCDLDGIAGVLFWGPEPEARTIATCLAARIGPILPLLTGQPDAGYVLTEQHLCVDTTAAGGNAALLASG
jgi:RHH-type proline utilization regulon transcriptional repressor/proline dehydrogenase/delta 1-pyrroline-5-carboxylate dehydrogenase